MSPLEVQLIAIAELQFNHSIGSVIISINCNVTMTTSPLPNPIENWCDSRTVQTRQRIIQLFRTYVQTVASLMFPFQPASPSHHWRHPVGVHPCFRYLLSTVPDTSEERRVSNQSCTKPKKKSNRSFGFRQSVITTGIYRNKPGAIFI